MSLKGWPTRLPTILIYLRRRDRVMSIIKDEMIAVKDEFATPRRTIMVDAEGEVEDEDLIAREEMVVTVTHAGYVKRTALSTYRAQKRGGKGRAGMKFKDEDFVNQLFRRQYAHAALVLHEHRHVLQNEAMAFARRRA